MKNQDTMNFNIRKRGIFLFSIFTAVTLSLAAQDRELVAPSSTTAQHGSSAARDGGSLAARDGGASTAQHGASATPSSTTAQHGASAAQDGGSLAARDGSLATPSSAAQDGVLAGAMMPVTLTLENAIMLAGDSSLEAFRSKNVYLSSHWEYRAFKADRLPSLTLNLTPGQYNRMIIKRYDSEVDVDIYRPQQAFEASGGLSVVQNFDLLGGTFFMNTNLDYLRNFGDNTYTQYTSVPVRIGYQQNLVGYNAFKWEKRIEPLKYEKAGKKLAYDLENTAGLAASYFFKLAMAQAEYDLAKENVRNTDTLFRIGEERYKIAAISQSDLLTLKLDRINATNSLKNADIALKRAMFALTSFLNMDRNTPIRIQLPSYPKSMDVSVEKALAEARANHPDLLGYKQNILELQQQVDRTKKESMFNASITASVGYNQVAGSLNDVYRDPLRQDIVALSVSIPLIDWGVRRGRYNMARNNLRVTEITARQGEVKIEEDVIMTVGDFNIQKDLIASAEEALVIADDAYDKTRQRFMIGKADISTLTLSRQRQQEARRNYISALENYWVSYFNIRKLTLYDFEYNLPVSSMLERRISAGNLPTGPSKSSKGNYLFNR